MDEVGRGGRGGAFGHDSDGGAGVGSGSGVNPAAKAVAIDADGAGGVNLAGIESIGRLGQIEDNGLVGEDIHMIREVIEHTVVSYLGLHGKRIAVLVVHREAGNADTAVLQDD